MGRFEVDLIVITPRRVVILEVKNWSGKLRVEGNRWIQVQRSGNEVVHDNLLTYNRDKLRALDLYLKQCGVNLPHERFHQAVVFANPRLDIDPAIKGHPAVVEFDGLGSVLGAPTSKTRLLAAQLIQRLADAETSASLSESLLQVVPPSQVKQAVQAIGQLRTWDRLTLRGGRILLGDLIWMRASGTQVAAESLNPGGEARLTWKRDLLGGFLWVVRDHAPGTMRGTLFMDHEHARTVPVTDQDCVYFHEVGSPTPSLIALSDIEQMVNG